MCRPATQAEPAPTGAATPVTAQPRLPVWLMAVMLVVLTIAFYWPALHNGFIWDDDSHLTNNPHLHGLAGLVSLWTTSAARICPLVLTSFWVQLALWGLVPWPYHLVNILMHAASGLVLWQVLRTLKVRGAWFGAALWVLHPVAVESVAWITELKNTQSALFYMLAIWFFVKWRLADASARRGRGRWRSVRGGVAVRRAGHGEQIVHGDPAVGAGAVRLVGGGALGLAQRVVRLVPLFVCSALSSAVSMWTQRLEGALGCGVGAERAGAPGRRQAGSCGFIWANCSGLTRWCSSIRVGRLMPRQVRVVSAAGAVVVMVLVVLWWKREGWVGGRVSGIGLFRDRVAAGAGLARSLFPAVFVCGGSFSISGEHRPPGAGGGGAFGGVGPGGEGQSVCEAGRLRDVAWGCWGD